MLSGSIPHRNSEKNLRTRERFLKLVIESIDPAIKKVGFDPSLIPNVDINNGVIHEAFAITEDLLYCMLITQASFYC